MNITDPPWEVTKRSDDMFFIGSPSVENRGNQNNGQNWVGTVWVPKSSGEFYGMGHLRRGVDDYARAETNAKLICLAPKLLEAAKSVLQTLEKYGSDTEEGVGALMILGGVVKELERDQK